MNLPSTSGDDSRSPFNLSPPKPPAVEHTLESELTVRYASFECLSDSAMASVWKVFPQVGDEPQALKVFPPEQQAAFRREAAVALGLSHPNIVRCLETFVLPDGHACLVYEYVDRGSLASFAVARMHKLLVKQVISDVLQGLMGLHARGYVHCDIKPANVLVRNSGTDKILRFIIADLGSCATLKEAQTGRYGVGSPAYCAPERLYNQFGYSSDIYSVGVMAFELLTGHLPFIGDVDEVYRAHLTRPMPLAEITDTVWREWLEQALHKLPQQRFSSAAIALNALMTGFEQRLALAVDAAPLTISTEKAPASKPSLRSVLPALPGYGLLPLNLSSWQSRGAVRAPAHQYVLSGARGEVIYLASDIGLQGLDFSTGQLTLLTPAPAPYAVFKEQLIYCSGSRIIAREGSSPSRLTLAEQVDHPTALACNQELIAFAEQRRVVLQRRSDASVCLALRHRHYAMHPLMALSGNTFAMTSGLANNELWIRKLNGDVVLKVSEDGPWLSLSASPEGFLAICSSLTRPTELGFFIFKEDGSEQHIRASCASLEVATCAHGFGFMAADKNICFLDARFTLDRIAEPVEGVYALALNAAGDTCFISAGQDANTLIACWHRSPSLPEIP